MKKILPILLSVVIIFSACGEKKGQQEKMTNQQAIEIITAKINKNEKDHKLYYDRARLYMQEKRVNDAIADLNKAIQLKDNEIDYHLLLADAYFANGDVEHSYSTLDRVLELDPENQEAVLKQGEIAYYSKDYDRAIDNMSKVTAKDPTNRTALSIKAFVYKEKGDTANAIVLLRKVCDLYPDYAIAFDELGVIYSAHRDPLAIEYFKTAIRLDLTNTNTIYNLAMFYQETNQMDAAEEAYKQILDLDSDNKHAWHNRGYIELFTYGDTDKAIEYFTRALQCDSLFVEAYVNRGCAYELNGDRVNAEHDFRSALAHSPAYQPAIDGLHRIGKAQ